MHHWILAAALATACGGKDASAPPVGSASDRTVSPPAPTPPPPDAPVDQAAAPTGPIRITSDSIGGLTTTTPGSRDAIAKLFPGFAVADEDSNDAEGNPIPLLIVKRGDDRVIEILRSDDKTGVVGARIYDPMFATAKEISTGSTVAQLHAAYRDLACELTVTEIDELTCTSSKLPNITFQIEGSPLSTKAGRVKPAAIRKATVGRIEWSAP